MKKGVKKRKVRIYKYKNDERNYDDPTYKKWRRDIAIRDGFCCQWPGCGCSQRLRFHHIRKWADYPSLRFELDNGITLCKEHHDGIWKREEDFERMFHSVVAQTKKNGKPTQKPVNRRKHRIDAKRKREISQSIRARLRKDVKEEINKNS